MSQLHTCPVCNGKGRGKLKQANSNVIAIAPCPLCDGDGQVDDVGLRRYRLCRDLMEQDQSNVKDIPLKPPQGYIPPF